MPPANSPINESSHLALPTQSRRTPSPGSFVPALRNFGSSVPDLASTLTLDTENDVDADNVSFLRNPALHGDESATTPRSSAARSTDRRRSSHLPSNDPSASQRTSTASASTRTQLQQQEHVQIGLRLFRGGQPAPAHTSHESSAESAPSPAMRPPYGDRLPDEQSLYDWAPASEEGDSEELADILRDLRQQQPNTHNDILRVLARAQLDAQNEHRRLTLARTQANDQTGSAQHEQSLRSAAILRTVRAHRQLAARSRDIMQGYVTARERSSTPGEQATGEDRQNSSNSSRWFRSSTPATRQSGEQREQRSGAISPTELADDADRAQRDRDREERRAAYRSALLRLERDRERGLISPEAVSSRISAAATATASSNRRSGETMDSLRRRYLEDPTTTATAMATATATATASTTTTTPATATGTPYKFENSIKLLDWLRNPEFHVNDLIKLLDREICNAGVAIEMPDLARLTHGLPPLETSWLRPGMVFSGFQHAAAMVARADTSGNTTFYRLANNQTISSTVINTPPSFTLPTMAAPGVLGSNGPPLPPGTNNLQRDRWAVRMTIHNIDYKTMTLQGTMEAFDVPSSAPSIAPHRPSTSALRSTLTNHPLYPRPSASSTPQPVLLPRTHYQSTFSTFVEGELIDFSHFTLATHSFPATSGDDAKYWRRLAPFARANDLAMARNALDSAWLTAELQHKYVLMRWKEKCFVKQCLTGRESRDVLSPATDAGVSNGHGLLSISGFYYVSLRREDGHIEGLYFDPASSPYQHLELAPENAARSGTWEFA